MDRELYSIFSPNSDGLVAVSEGMLAVKLCSNKSLAVLN